MARAAWRYFSGQLEDTQVLLCLGTKMEVGKLLYFRTNFHNDPILELLLILCDFPSVSEPYRPKKAFPSPFPGIKIAIFYMTNPSFNIIFFEHKLNWIFESAAFKYIVCFHSKSEFKENVFNTEWMRVYTENELSKRIF